MGDDLTEPPPNVDPLQAKLEYSAEAVRRAESGFLDTYRRSGSVKSDLLHLAFCGFHDALKIDATCDVAHRGLGQVALLQDNWKQARTHFENALELNRSAKNLFAYGNYFLNCSADAPSESDFETIIGWAKSQFEQALSIAPDNVQLNEILRDFKKFSGPARSNFGLRQSTWTERDRVWMMSREWREANGLRGTP